MDDDYFESLQDLRPLRRTKNTYCELGASASVKHTSQLQVHLQILSAVV